jgi:hypothetical protein
MAPALYFLLNYRDAIFPGTPMVFCGLDRAQLGTRLLPPTAHGVLAAVAEFEREAISKCE